MPQAGTFGFKFLQHVVLVDNSGKRSLNASVVTVERIGRVHWFTVNVQTSSQQQQNGLCSLYQFLAARPRLTQKTTTWCSNPTCELCFFCGVGLIHWVCTYAGAYAWAPLSSKCLRERFSLLGAYAGCLRRVLSPTLVTSGDSKRAII